MKSLINIVYYLLIFSSQNLVNVSSPSKIVPPKYATKQEIANTYMNKYGPEVLQKYRLLQQQHQQLQSNHLGFNGVTENNTHVKQPSNDETESETSTSSSHTNLPSSSSSLGSLSPVNANTNPTTKQIQPSSNASNVATSCAANTSTNVPFLKNFNEMNTAHVYQHSNKIVSLPTLHTFGPSFPNAILKTESYLVF